MPTRVVIGDKSLNQKSTYDEKLTNLAFVLETNSILSEGDKKKVLAEAATAIDELKQLRAAISGEWIEFGGSLDSFKKAMGDSIVGYQVELNNGKDTDVLLIGDINSLFGGCNCCEYSGTVVRYRRAVCPSAS